MTSIYAKLFFSIHAQGEKNVPTFLEHRRREMGGCGTVCFVDSG